MFQQPIRFPRGHLSAYYFDLRRRGFSPRAAFNATSSHASAQEIRWSDREHLTEYYQRANQDTND